MNTGKMWHCISVSSVLILSAVHSWSFSWSLPTLFALNLSAFNISAVSLTLRKVAAYFCTELPCAVAITQPLCCSCIGRLSSTNWANSLSSKASKYVSKALFRIPLFVFVWKKHFHKTSTITPCSTYLRCTYLVHSSAATSPQWQ